MHPTIAVQFEKYLASRSYSRRTQEEYCRDVRSFLNWLGGQSPFPKQKHYQKYLNLLSQKNLSAKTISRSLSALKAFSRFLFGKRQAAKDEAQPLTHPKIKTRPLRILKQAELRRLREVTGGDAYSEALLETLLQTGMTISQLAGLKKSQVVFRKGPAYGSINISPGQSVPINNRLEAVLTERLLKKNSSFVFPGRSFKAISIRAIRSRLARLFGKAKIKGVVVNDLRNTFIYYQLEKGVDPRTIADWVGFKNIVSLNPFLKRLGKRIVAEQRAKIV